jgi:uncharacterized protein YhhL (DUF1145 family)
MFSQINKIATVIFWLAAITIQLLNINGPAAWLPIIALVIAAIHIVEVALFLILYKDISKTPSKDAALIFTFGIFHFYPLVAKKGI